MFPDRASGGPARAERMIPAEVAELLLADLPSYGPEVNAIHEQTVQSLAKLPAWRLRYRTLEDAIRLLFELTP